MRHNEAYDARVENAQEGVRLYDEMADMAEGLDVSSVIYACAMILTDIILHSDNADEIDHIVFTLRDFLKARQEMVRKMLS